MKPSAEASSGPLTSTTSIPAIVLLGEGGHGDREKEESNGDSTHVGEIRSGARCTQSGWSETGLTCRRMPQVLLVADASWVANGVKASLALGDWEIDTLRDPRSVLDEIEDTDPDVVIVDMQVGSMGGMAVIRAIRGAIDAAERPRTVLLLDRKADEFLAGRAGADSCVMKPIVASELREAMGYGPVADSLEEE